MEFLYGILLISLLIFIHESGHFLCAKWFGIEVSVFSIGFGPRLFSYRFGETEYRLSLFPFGGFVKMLEETSASRPLSVEEKARSFEAQKLWKRVVTALAGPLMNLCFPFFLYLVIYLDDKQFIASHVGYVEEGSPADGKLMPGDRIWLVDNESVLSSSELQEALEQKANHSTKMTVEREGKFIDVFVTPEEIEIALDPPELGLKEKVTRIGISHSFSAPVVGITNLESPAYKAGLRSFDQILAIGGQRVSTMVQLVEILAKNRGDSVQIAYLRPKFVPYPSSGTAPPWDLGLMVPGVVNLTPVFKEKPSTETPQPFLERDVEKRTGLESIDLYIAYISQSSTEWNAGIRPGDRLVSFDELRIPNWKQLQPLWQKANEGYHDLVVRRAGADLRFHINKLNQNSPLQIAPWQPKSEPQTVPNPSRFQYAVKRSMLETWRSSRFILRSFTSLLQGKVSLRNVSGPIAILDAAGEAGTRGIHYFLWAMALISINLGILNLAPIPVLDGGHILFALVESMLGKKIQARTRELTSLAGMGLLLLLSIIALYNDANARLTIWRNHL